MLQAFEWVRRREERERGKGEKNEQCNRRGYQKYPIANTRNNICKKTARKKKNISNKYEKHLY
jgi:hypothetical protein